MKEKEVDIWLSLASVCQIVFIGSSGAFFAEITKDIPKIEMAYLEFFGSSVCGIGMVISYSRAFELVKTNKS